ncbi:hypothetical protein OOT46_14090 [Aquabacterium sp. A7-Y]|uniref:hypothetical protein n=1 Tax=Aquabacterium sp. A7-Y TaxID=1349605 RepID=UPI00223DED02|nr:hypothetical protein [Aquabacterium sp. A7-Y]MCW7538972.1 hypothetical protein [Aquabacterium sp. A7-Y]
MLPHIPHRFFAAATPWIVAILATVLWSMAAGKDVSWDVVNHHLYLPFSWLSGRTDADLFPVGPQSYQNPLAYVPFYVMVVSEWPAWSIGLVLAALHSANLVLLWHLALCLWKDQHQQRLWAFIATALGGITPVFLQNAGTSSIDPFTSILVLGALLCVIHPGAAKSDRAMVGAGLLAGFAFAFKQSNATYCLALAGVLLLQPWTGTRKLHTVLLFGLGGIAGAAAGIGWWSWMLWERFGNPLFPLLNDIFQSPYAPQQPMLADRFRPHTGMQWISRIWEMAWLKRFIYQEIFTPDIRPAAALSVAMIGLAGAALRRLGVLATSASAAGWTRVDTSLTGFALISYVLWLYTSGNGRYGLPLLMVCGVLLARWACLALPQAVARIALLVIGVSQMLYFSSAGDVRFVPKPWDDESYLDVQVPDRLKAEPFLHLTLGLQTNGVVAPFLHHGGAMINPIGQLALPMDGPTGHELKRRLKHWEGRTRFLFPAFSMEDPKIGPKVSVLLSDALYRFGLDVDWSDCETIVFGNPSAGSGLWATSLHGEYRDGKIGRRLLSCRAAPIQRVWPNYEAERKAAEAVFHKLERTCPRIYGPPAMATDRGVLQWQRFYPNTDAIVSVSETAGVIVQHGRRNIDQYLGSIEEVMQGKRPINCEMWSLLAPD